MEQQGQQELTEGVLVLDPLYTACGTKAQRPSLLPGAHLWHVSWMGTRLLSCSDDTERSEASTLACRQEARLMDTHIQPGWMHGME